MTLRVNIEDYLNYGGLKSFINENIFPNDFILITGPAGSGKTSFSKYVNKVLGRNICHLDLIGNNQDDGPHVQRLIDFSSLPVNEFPTIFEGIAANIEEIITALYEAVLTRYYAGETDGMAPNFNFKIIYLYPTAGWIQANLLSRLKSDSARGCDDKFKKKIDMGSDNYTSHLSNKFKSIVTRLSAKLINSVFSFARGDSYIMKVYNYTNDYDFLRFCDVNDVRKGRCNESPNGDSSYDTRSDDLQQSHSL